MQNTYLDFANEYTQKKTFVLPNVDLKLEDVANLEISPFLRLGNRLEKFFSFILKHSEQYEILFENLQIIENKTTLGELDFIIKDLITNEILHVELGAKLYLYFPNFKDEGEKFVGPNQKDALFFKLQKLKDEQFPLLYYPKTQEILRSKGIDVYEIQQQICLKVRVFLPKNYSEIPLQIKKENIYGYYINLEEFENEQYKQNQYFIPDKKDWIVSPEYCEKWFSYDEILPLINKMHSSKQSPLIWMKNETQIESFFVIFW